MSQYGASKLYQCVSSDDKVTGITGVRSSQAAGIDGHASGCVEDRPSAQEQEHTDEDVVDDADVEEHLQGRPAVMEAETLCS